MNTDPPTTPHGRASRLVPLALLIVPALLLAVPVFRGEALVPGSILFSSVPPWKGPMPPGESPCRYPLGDQAVQFHPWLTLAGEDIRDGRLPLWNPYSNCGSPLLANGQSAPFFPTRLLALFLPIAPATWASAFLRLAVALLGTYGLARAFGLARPAAAFAAIAFSLSGFIVVWLDHPQGNVAPFLPVILLLVERGVRNPGGRTAAALAAVIGLQFFGGHPETSFHLLLATGAFALYRIAGEWSRDRSPAAAARRAGWLLGAAVFGALLAAVALFPLLEYLKESSAFAARSIKSGVGKAATHPLDLRTFIGLFFPRYFGVAAGSLADIGLARSNNFNEMAGGYVGVPVLAAALSSLGGPWQRHRLFFAILAAACLPLVYDFGAPSRWLNDLPVLSIAANRRFLLVLALALSLLAGFGIDGLLRSGGRQAGRVMLAVCLAGALGIGAVAWSREKAGLFVPDYRLFAAAQALGLALLAAAAFLRGRGILSSPVLFGGLVALAALADLLPSDLPVNRGVSEANLFPDTPLLRALRERTADGSRILQEGDVLQPETSVVPRLRSIRGYDAVEVRRYTELFSLLCPKQWRAKLFVKNAPTIDRFDSPILDLLAVKFVLTSKPIDPPPPGLRLEGQTEGVFVYANDEAMPRAFVVPRARVIAAADARLEALASAEFDPRRETILEEEAGGGGASGPGDASWPATILEERSDLVRLQADGGSSGATLVLADTWFPGWKARVDGANAPLLRADHALRAVRLPAGPHRVEFAYEPASVAAGLWTSLAAAAAILAAGVVGLRRRRPDSRPASGPRDPARASR